MISRELFWIIVAIVIGVTIYETTDLIMTHADKWVEQGIENSRNVIER